MNINLVGAGVINSIKPYCKKYVIESLEAFEFALLNTLIIVLLLFGYMIYSKKSIATICYKYYALTWTQIFFIITLSIITLTGTLLKLSYDKTHPHTFTNGMVVKGITSMIVIIVGIMFYNEIYTIKTYIGIIIISIGLYLLEY